MQNYTIYNEADYFEKITRRIAKAGRGTRISLISMMFEPSERPVRLLVEELIAAAKRGARIELLIDAHAFMLTSSNLPLGPLFWHQDILKGRSLPHFYQKAQLLEELKQAGGHYEVINQPATWPAMPITGRSHIKATVINNEAFVGGCNLGASHQIDCMVRLRDDGVAAWLHELIDTIAKHKSTRRALKGKDMHYPLDKQSVLLVDAGTPDQSLIFQEALHLIDEAKQWLVIACQFLPSGVTGKHLVQAQKRGVAVYSIFNHPLRRDTVTLPAQYFIHAREKLRAPKDLFQAQLPVSHRRLHTKLIATERGAIVGSHNYLSSGVKLGTAEIALLRLEPTFAHQAASLLFSQLAPGSRSHQLLKDILVS